MIFDWDPAKALRNKAKHGIQFEDALRALYDPWAIYLQDPDHSEMERREKVIGEYKQGLVVIIFTELQEEVIRIISARPPTRHERMNYEKRRGI